MIDKNSPTVEWLALALSGYTSWPSNEELGGGLTGTRDDEYKDAMREQAVEFIEEVLNNLGADHPHSKELKRALAAEAWYTPISPDRLAEVLRDGSSEAPLGSLTGQGR